MPNAGAKYSSEYLTRESLASSLRSVHSVIQAIFGECTFTAYYGCASNIHGDLQYKPMRVGSDVIQWFIEDSIVQRIVIPGESDLLLYSPQEELKLIFCHESDIHVDGSSAECMQQFMASPPFCSFRWYSQAELEARMQRDPKC